MRLNHALLLVFLFVPAAACQTFSEIDIIVPAVSQDPVTAVMIGVPVRLNVKMVSPGTGEIFVNTRALTEMDMQGSARLAAIVAGDVTGENVVRPRGARPGCVEVPVDGVVLAQVQCSAGGVSREA